MTNLNQTCFHNLCLSRVHSVVEEYQKEKVNKVAQIVVFHRKNNQKLKVTQWKNKMTLKKICLQACSDRRADHPAKGTRIPSYLKTRSKKENKPRRLMKEKCVSKEIRWTQTLKISTFSMIDLE